MVNRFQVGRSLPEEDVMTRRNSNCFLETAGIGGKLK